MRRPDEGVRPIVMLLLEPLGSLEVTEIRQAFIVDQYVRGFQVSVDDVVRMQVIKHQCQFKCVVLDDGLRHDPQLHLHLEESDSFDVLQEQIRVILVLLAFVESADVGVVQGRDYLLVVIDSRGLVEVLLVIGDLILRLERLDGPLRYQGKVVAFLLVVYSDDILNAEVPLDCQNGGPVSLLTQLDVLVNVLH